MRKLIVLAVLLALAFAGYWFAGARTLERGVAGWIEQRRAEGWVAETGGIATSGFPGRFETVITDLQLADPDTGVAWTARRFTVLAQSARPNRITAIWPNAQTVSTPFERIDVAADRMEAAIAFVPGTRLEVRTLELDLDRLALASTRGWQTRLDRGHLSAIATDAPDTYDLRFEATGVVPTDGLRTVLDPARILPEVMDGFTATGTVVFDAPWDRFAVEDARPRIIAIDLDDMRASWGELELRAAGTLTVDAGGIPDGRISVKATNWREMLGMARNAGLVPEPLIPTLERALGMLAGLSGPPDTLDAPLTFQNGFVFFGPIPLGPAPRVTIR